MAIPLMPCSDNRDGGSIVGTGLDEDVQDPPYYIEPFIGPGP